MSAPLRLTATDLRNLANGLEALTKSQKAWGVGPSWHSPAVSIRTENGDDLTLQAQWVSASTDDIYSDGEWIIDDRYGS